MRKYTRNESSINHRFPTPAVSGKTSHKFETDHIKALKTIVGLNRAIESQRLHFSNSEAQHFTEVLECA